MEHNKPDAKPDNKPDNKSGPGNAEIQSATDKHTEQGYEGVKVDETPDEEYSVKGVIKALK